MSKNTSNKSAQFKEAATKAKRQAAYDMGLSLGYPAPAQTEKEAKELEAMSNDLSLQSAFAMGRLDARIAAEGLANVEASSRATHQKLWEMGYY